MFFFHSYIWDLLRVSPDATSADDKTPNLALSLVVGNFGDGHAA